MTKKFHIVKQIGNRNYSEWTFPSLGIHKMRCCDCGLVHDFIFGVLEKIGNGGRIYPMTKMNKKMNKLIAFKARRNDSQTAKARKLNKYKKRIKKLRVLP